MEIYSATEKVFKNTNHDIASQDQSEKEELLETAHDALPNTLPSIFSLSGGSLSQVDDRGIEEVAALCRAQRNKPLRDQYSPIAYAVTIGRHDVVKFLIDQGESVNEGTPDMPVLYDNNQVGVELGRTPLEIAISQKDAAMVKILTTHHPENRATPEINYQRYINLRRQKEHYNIDKKQLRADPSSPLLDALKSGNQEIVDLVIKAYTDPKRLYADRTAIKTVEPMLSWIEQNLFLWKGERVEVSGEVACLFLNKQGLNASSSDVETLLQHGWIATRAEFEQALKTNDSNVLQQLISHTRTEEGFFSLLTQYNRADLVESMIEQGETPTEVHLHTAITHGALDVVRLFIEKGVPSEGAFQLAIEQKQWRVAGYFGKDFDEVVSVCRSQKDNPPIVLAVKMGRHDVVKFFIDQGESVNTTTPDIIVRSWSQGKVVQKGYSPLEIAIVEKDVAMVKILTTYNATNRATTEISYHRYKPSVLIYRDDNTYSISREEKEDPSSPLLDALKTGNQEIIQLVITAYTDPNRLYAEYAAIRVSQNPSAMRLWIAQNMLLWKGEQKEISEDVIDLFLSPRIDNWVPVYNGNNAPTYIHNVVNIFTSNKGVSRTPSDIEKLLQHGWVVTKRDLEQALAKNDPEIVRLLIDHPRREQDPLATLAQHNRADMVKYVIEKGAVPTKEHLEIAIRHGALDVVKTLVEYGISLDGMLRLAVDQKQLPTARYLADSTKNIYEIVEVCRAQISKPPVDRYTPLAFAVQLGRHDVVKFFLDHGEPVNVATPDVPVVVTYDCNSEKDTCSSQVGMQSGYTPLEIAVRRQDLEMVKILLSHNPENRANPDVHYHRFDVFAHSGDTSSGYRSRNDVYETHSRGADSHILKDALKLENQEIIELLIKAYSDPGRLYAEYAVIRDAQKPEAMRTWIEQNMVLTKGEHKEVSDTVVMLFMKNRQGLVPSLSELEILSQYGWIVTKQEFEQALTGGDPQIIGSIVAHLLEKGSVLAREYFDIAIKQGSIVALEAFVDQGLFYEISCEGALLFATGLKQKAVVEYLLGLPIDKKEIEEARTAAYQIHAYDIMELLESRLVL